MEGCEDGLHEWRDFVTGPKGVFLGFSPEACLPDFASDFCGGEDRLGVSNEKAVEESKVDLNKELESCGKVLNSSNPNGIKTGGSIAERRAAKFGFNAPIVNTPRFRSSSLLPSPHAQSPHLTMPAGVSHAALLDSPLLLPNLLPSPTTGSFRTPVLDGDSQMLVSSSFADAGKGIDRNAAAAGGLAESLDVHVDLDTLISLPPPLDFEFPVPFPEEVAVNSYDADSPADRKNLDGLTFNANFTTLSLPYSNSVPCIQMECGNEPALEADSGILKSLDGDHNETYVTTGTVRNAEDGYSWRKYGQKQVKGGEYPRSYYKCTHPNCQVKKKVERSLDGQITEIIYKGAHDHPKPQPCRKSAFGASFSISETSDVGDGSVPCVKSEISSVWKNIQSGCKDVNLGLVDWKTNGLERTSSASVMTEVSDPRSSSPVKPMCILESVGTPELSTLASHEDDKEDATTQKNFSLGDNEPDSKRRKKEPCFEETTIGSRAVREPKVVVQIESEIDVLDDGYRWRKYGQKVVKGNPNPRSYYKCTSAGCTVRKHVERASHNLKFVLTTYEGKHNHEVPAARNRCQVNSGSGSLPHAATNTQSALILPRDPHFEKTEPHVQELSPHYDGKLGCNTDFLRANFLGYLGGGTSTFHRMNLPSLPNARPYGPCGSSNHHAAYYGALLSAIPDISIGLPLGLPHSSNLAFANCNNPVRTSSVQPLVSGHQSGENYSKLRRPKQEQGDESFYDNIDQTNSSIYNHVV